MATGGFCLLLYDADGCTDVVATKRLRTDSSVKAGLRCQIHYGNALHKVEVLKVAESKTELDQWEFDWGRSARAVALDQAKQQRVRTGFLEIPYEEGTNGRQIVVLAEGAGDHTNDTIVPVRAPRYLEDLTEDQIDIVNSQVLDHRNGKASIGTQTDPVLIFSDEKDMFEAFDPKERTLDQLYQLIRELSTKLLATAPNPPLAPSAQNDQMTVHQMTIQPTAQNDQMTVQPTAQNDQMTVQPTAQNDQMTVQPTAQNEQMTVQPTAQNDQMTVQPTAQNDQMTVQPTAQNDQMTVQPTAQNDQMTIQPTAQNDQMTVQPTAQNDQMTVQPTAQNDQMTVQPTAQNDQMTVQPTAQNDQMTVQPTAQNDQMTVQPTAQNDQMTVQPTNDENCPEEPHSVHIEFFTSDESFINETVVEEVTQEDLNGAVLLANPFNVPQPPPINSISVVPVPNQLNSVRLCDPIPDPLSACFTGPIVEIRTASDMAGIPPNAEVRISTGLQNHVKSCSKYPRQFGWSITKNVFEMEELRGRNFYGRSRGDVSKLPFSPRRRHAIQHAVRDSLGGCPSVLQEVVEGINDGIRNRLRGKKKRTSTPISSL